MSHSADSSFDSHDSSSQCSSSVDSESESDEKHKQRKHKRRIRSKQSKKKKKRRELRKSTDDQLFKRFGLLIYLSVRFIRDITFYLNLLYPVLVDSCTEKQVSEAENQVEEEKELGGKREKPVVRPEEIPPVPENRFLLRRDVPSQEQKPEMCVFVLGLLSLCLFSGQIKSGSFLL